MRISSIWLVGRSGKPRDCIQGIGELRYPLGEAPTRRLSGVCYFYLPLEIWYLSPAAWPWGRFSLPEMA